MESVVSRPAGVLDFAVVRLRARTGEVVGSGFLVEAGHIVTCAHVVARALGRDTPEAPAETDTVLLDFPLVAAGVMVHARVEVWHPIQDDDTGDIAVLSLVGDPPAGIRPAYLVATEDLWAHPFRTFGFPRRHDHGVWASGVLRARQAAGWVQMEGGPSGYAVEAGFSGAAVWDDELAGVVGMTVAADARSDLRAAYLIPADVLIRAWPRLTERTLPPCPYRGLHPFRERDVAVFFGRQDLTDRLVTEVGRRPLVAVVGPSGSGKSSVVFAGLLPQMLQKEGWMSVTMRPAQASSPLFALAAALLPVLDPDQSETERLAALSQLASLLREGSLHDVVERILARACMTDLLLVVDQFEELFAREGDNATEFISALLSALRARRDVPPRGLTVVLTLRADFLGQALQDAALAVALQGAVTTIGQMGRDQLRAVIEGPLPQGVSYEVGLVERILGDVGEEPGSLPLLEFALTLLWERQDRGTLTHAAYERLGGVEGALASYAERVYVEQLRSEDQEEARRLLIQLVRPSEVGDPVRRVARRPELGEVRWQLGQRLAATRLLVADRDPTGVESVELVHEALIGGWSRLHEWVDDDRAFRIWQERLRGSAAEWETVRRDPGALLRGAPLAEAERWLAERPDDVGDPERQFIQASGALRDRSVRRLRVAVTALTMLLVLALSLGGVALWQFNRADNQSRLAQSRSLVTQANSLVASQPDVALLLAAAAYKIEDTTEATDTLTRMASEQRHVDRLLVTDAGADPQIVFSPTDSSVVALASAKGVTLWDVEKNIPLKRRQAAEASTPAFSPDGRILAFMQRNGQGDQTVVMWFHAEDRVLDLSPGLTPDEYLSGLTFSPDGELLGACIQTPIDQLLTSRIQLWTVDPPEPRHSIPLSEDFQCAFGFTDGSRGLAYVDGEEIVKWDTAARRVVTRSRLVGPSSSPDAGVSDEIFGFAVTPNGRSAMYTMSTSRGMEILWWDLDRQVPMPEMEMLSPQGAPLFVSFTPDSRLAAVEMSGAVLLVDIVRRVPLAIYNLGESGGVLSPDGSLIAASGGGSVIALREAEAPDKFQIPVDATDLAVQPDNKHITTVSSAGKVAIHSLGEPDPIIVIPSVDDEVNWEGIEALSPNGLRYAAAGDPARHIRLLDLSSYPPVEAPLEEYRGDVLRLSFDPSSDFLASADASEVIIWAAKDRAEVSRIPLPPGYATTSLAVSPRGRYIATSSSDGETRLWDTTSNNLTGTALPADDTTSLTFSPDGRWLSIGSQNEIRLWNLDAEQFDSRQIPVGITPTRGTPPMRFSPDGALLAASHRTASFDVVSVWNVRDVQTAGTVSVGWSGIYDFAFTPDSARLAVAGQGIFVEPFNASWALQHVCQIVGRNLTREEWNQHAQGFDYIATCP